MRRRVRPPEPEQTRSILRQSSTTSGSQARPRATSGSETSEPDFVAVYEAHVSRVYGFLAYRLDQRSDAEDLTQATFERALKAWHRYDPSRAAIGTWLIAIANNLLIDHYRSDRSGGLERLDSDDLPEAWIPSAPAVDEDLGLDPALQTALQKLTQREREAVALRYGADLSGAEIAAVLGLNVANIHQLLSRALRKLRAELGERS